MALQNIHTAYFPNTTNASIVPDTFDSRFSLIKPALFLPAKALPIKIIDASIGYN